MPEGKVEEAPVGTSQTPAGEAKAPPAGGEGEVKGVVGDAAQQTPLPTQWEESPEFREFQSKMNGRIAQMERRATQAERQAQEVEARYQGIVQTLRGADPDTGIGEVAEEVWAAEQEAVYAQQSRASAAQAEILRQVKSGVPIEVFDPLMESSRPPNPEEIAATTADYYRAQADEERRLAREEIKKMREQATAKIEEEINALRKQAGMDRLPGAPVEGGTPTEQDVQMRQYLEEVDKLPPNDTEGRARLRQQYRRQGLTL